MIVRRSYFKWEHITPIVTLVNRSHELEVLS